MILVLATIALFAQDSVYAKPESWLCRPTRSDACAVDLTTTVLQGNGSTSTEKWAASKKPPIDCFYVYPTVSRDTTDVSDMVAGDEERDVVRQQFARFASQCRPFAPLYRQVTLRGLQKRLAAPARVPLNRGVSYDDVASAWAYYLAHDNNGRGVVLIGHSQGSYVLEELIKREIDGKPVQRLIVSAMLLGANIAVPVGKDVGGAFQSMALCRQPDQVGCVITYGSFRSTVPPSERALFGRVAGAGMEAGCTNPAALGGGSAPLRAYFSATGSLIIGAAPKSHRWLAQDAPLGTPFVSVPGLLTAECINDANGARLTITVHPDSADPRADDIPGDIGTGSPLQAQWGLHLIDVNLSMGNLIEIVGRQSKAYHAGKKH